MKVAVLMGGLSKEREISLRSGGAVSLALKKKGHEVLEVDVTGVESITSLSKQKVDKAFIALHGKFGEDGLIQAILEWLKIPYTGSTMLSSALCYHKNKTKELVKNKGVKTPDSVVIQKSDSLYPFIDQFFLGFPCIVKPNTEGSSIGVYRVLKKEDLEESVTKALQYDPTVLVEKYIQGRELTVGVLHGKALPVVEVVPKSGFYDFEAKYTPGKTSYLVPAPLSEAQTKQVQEISQNIYRFLDCRGAIRVDFMLDKNPYFLEVNTIPGMTETSLLPKAAKEAGMNFEDLCEEMLKSGDS